MRINPLWRIIAGLAVTMPVAAIAVPITYQATLAPLNSSGVNGTATLVLKQDIDELTVTINASGLEPGMLHPQHIHGRFNSEGEAINSVSPDPSEDTDGDGVIELVEAFSSYGAIIVPLTSPPGEPLAFPTAPDGTINFTQIYDLSSDATYAGDFGVDDLLPLHLREIVLHGGFAIPGPDANGPGLPGLGQQTDNTGDPIYIAALPVASGEIFQLDDGANAVPEPSTVWLLLIGLTATALGLRGTPRRFRT